MKQNARTTVSIPIELLQNVDEVIRSGRFTSRNDFFATAIRRELERMQREVIDRQFAGMAEDSIYQNEGRHISKEYEYADWEALRVAERDS